MPEPLTKHARSCPGQIDSAPALGPSRTAPATIFGYHGPCPAQSRHLVSATRSGRLPPGARRCSPLPGRARAGDVRLSPVAVVRIAFVQAGLEWPQPEPGYRYLPSSCPPGWASPRGRGRDPRRCEPGPRLARSTINRPGAWRIPPCHPGPSACSRLMRRRVRYRPAGPRVSRAAGPGRSGRNRRLAPAAIGPHRRRPKHGDGDDRGTRQPGPRRLPSR